MSNKWMLTGAALLGATAVMSGAFGAHALQGVLTSQAKGWYDTAVTYHAGHALALLACGLLGLHLGTGPGSGWLQAAGVCFIAGILVFSGTLYAMAFTGITRLGMITPIGGALLIAAWLCLAIASTRLTA
jgi:uncharacterized membrane protein YgdD (TMEM256/DUF423 family)